MRDVLEGPNEIDINPVAVSGYDAGALIEIVREAAAESEIEGDTVEVLEAVIDDVRVRAGDDDDVSVAQDDCEMGAEGVDVDVAEPLTLITGVAVISFVTDDVEEALTDAELVEVVTTELEADSVPEVQVDGVWENDLIGEKESLALWLTCSDTEGLGERDALGDPDTLREKETDIEGRALTEDSAVRDATCTVALADVFGEFEVDGEDDSDFDDRSDRESTAVDDH